MMKEKERKKARYTRYKKYKRLKGLKSLALVVLVVLMGSAALSAGVVLAFRTNLVSNKIRYWSAEKLSGVLGAPISYSGISMNWNGEIEVRDLLIKDPSDNNLVFVSAPKVVFDIQFYGYRIWELGLSNVELERPIVNFRQLGEDGWNYDRFRKNRDKRETKDGKEGKPTFTIEISNISINNGQVVFERIASVPIAFFVTLSGEDLNLTRDRIQAKVRSSNLSSLFLTLIDVSMTGKIKYENGVLNLKELVLSKGETSIKADGTIDFRDDEYNIAIGESKFDLDHLPVKWKMDDVVAGIAQISAELTGHLNDPKVVAAVSISKGHFAGFHINDLNSKLFYGQKILEVRNLSVDLLDGKFVGRVNFDFNPEVSTYQMNAEIVGIDLMRLIQSSPVDLRSQLTGSLVFSGRGFEKENFLSNASLNLAASKLGDLEIDSLQSDVEISATSIFLRDCAIAIDDQRIVMNGGIKEGRIDFDVEAQKLSLAHLGSVFSNPDLKGELGFVGRIEGEQSNPKVQGHVVVKDGRYKEIGFDNLEGSVILRNIKEDRAGKFNLDITNFSYEKTVIPTIKTEWEIEKNIVKIYNMEAYKDSSSYLQFSGEAIVEGEEEFVVNLTRARAAYKGREAYFTSPFSVIRKKDVIRLEKTVGAVADGNLVLSGLYVVSEDSMKFNVGLNNFRLKQGDVIFGPMRNVTGILGIELSVEGTRENPRASLDLAIKNFGYSSDLEAASVDSLNLSVRYDNMKIYVEELKLSEMPTFTDISASFPMDLRLIPLENRMLEGEIDGKIIVYNLDLRLLNVFTNSFDLLSGTLNGQVSIAGTMQNPKLDGNCTVKGGSLLVIPTNSEFDNIDGTMAVSNDELRIESLQSTSPYGGKLFVEGTVKVENMLPASYDLRIKANKITVQQMKYLSAAQFDANVTLTGDTSKPKLKGNVDVSGGELNLSLDKMSGNQNGERQSSFPLEYDLKLKARSNLWIRNKQANVELSLNMKILSEIGDMIVSGELRTLRGSYSLYGRRFKVLTGGVHFLESKGFNGVLDISTQRVVRGQVKVGDSYERVTNTFNLDITGSTSDPIVTVSIEEHPGISQQEAVTLLLFDLTKEEFDAQPTFSQKKLGNQAANFLTSRASPFLQGLTGIDDISIETELFSGSEDRSARVTIGKYLSQDVFFSYSQDILNPSVGSVSLEYFFGDRRSVGMEYDSGGNSSVDLKYRIKY